MSLLWQTWLKPVIMIAKDIKMKDANAIVQHLLDTHPTCDMNHLSRMGDLSYVDYRTYATAAEPNRNWCAGCSPDNCSGCGGEPVGYVAHGSTMPRNIRVFSGCEILDKERASEYMPECISPLFTTQQPDRTAELEAALKVALAALKDFDYDKRMEAIARIEGVMK